MTGITSYNVDPNLNTTVQGVFIGENCPAGNLNDAERALMSDLALWLADAGGPLLKSGGTLSGALAMALFAITAMGNGSTISDGQSTPTNRPIGYRSFPFTAGTAGRVVALTDVGMCIPATGNITIPTNATTAFAIGDVIGIYNNSASSITIAAVTPGTTTLRLGGVASTGTRTLAQRGYAALLKVAADEWVALNGGLT
jgi:hypothetical protein